MLQKLRDKLGLMNHLARTDLCLHVPFLLVLQYHSAHLVILGYLHVHVCIICEQAVRRMKMDSTSKATLLCQVITGRRTCRSPLKAGIIMVNTLV